MTTGAGSCTVRVTVVEPVRPCASVMVMGTVSSPVAGPAVARNEKTLSPAAASPCVWSSNKACAAAPPMAVRFAVTLSPELVGFWPGETATVKSAVAPG